MKISKNERGKFSFLLLTLNNFTSFSNASIIEFEQVNVSWEISFHHERVTLTFLTPITRQGLLQKHFIDCFRKLSPKALIQYFVDLNQSSTNVGI